MKIIGENNLSSMLLVCLIALIFAAGIVLRKKPDTPSNTAISTASSSRK